MTLLAGLMSSVSSASGVVMPALIPTIPRIISELGGGVSALSLSAAVILGAHAVPYSPLSTMGAIGMAVASERSNKAKLFTDLLIAAGAMLLLTAILFFIGLYNVF